jgi:hypothetical protein
MELQDLTRSKVGIDSFSAVWIDIQESVMDKRRERNVRRAELVREFFFTSSLLVINRIFFKVSKNPEVAEKRRGHKNEGKLKNRKRKMEAMKGARLKYGSGKRRRLE